MFRGLLLTLLVLLFILSNGMKCLFCPNSKSLHPMTPPFPLRISHPLTLVTGSASSSTIVERPSSYFPTTFPKPFQFASPPSSFVASSTIPSLPLLPISRNSHYGAIKEVQDQGWDSWATRDHMGAIGLRKVKLSFSFLGILGVSEWHCCGEGQRN